MNRQSQDKNTVGGDLVGRDKNVVNVKVGTQSLISRLNDQYLQEAELGRPIKQNLEDLQHYMARSTDSDVRGLKEKLEAANRSDLLNYAERLKEKAYKRIMEYQTSPTAQKIFEFSLLKLLTTYQLEVWPLILEGSSRPAVDERISGLLNKCYSLLEANELGLQEEDLLGLLFFLGGNCHLRWENTKC